LPSQPLSDRPALATWECASGARESAQTRTDPLSTTARLLVDLGTPQTQYGPTLSSQHPIDNAIASSVAFKLGDPEIGIRRRRRTFGKPFPTVPKVPVHENSERAGTETKIRASKYATVVASKPEAELQEHFGEPPLGLGSLGAHGTHDSTSNLGLQRINHDVSREERITIP
jgi:hypothetical protein